MKSAYYEAILFGGGLLFVLVLSALGPWSEKLRRRMSLFGSVGFGGGAFVRGLILALENNHGGAILMMLGLGLMVCTLQSNRSE